MLSLGDTMNSLSTTWPSGDARLTVSVSANAAAAAASSSAHIGRMCRRVINEKRGSAFAPPLHLKACAYRLRPAIARLLERQRPDAIAGCRENRIRDRRQNRRHGRFAHTRRRILRLNVVHFDVGRSRGNPQQRMIVEVTLDHPAAI